MINPGIQRSNATENINDRFLTELKGTLYDDVARSTLAQFLNHNIGITTELITGVKLYPYQEIILRAWWQHNFCLNIWSRGGAKSWLVSMFCMIYPLFNPETRIVIASSNFRRSRAILEQCERFLASKSAHLLKQCYPKIINKRNDLWKLDINGGFISALPLATGNSIRGQRAEVLIVDEFLLVPEEVYKSTLFPFLVANSGIQESLKLEEIERGLKKEGLINKEDIEGIKSIKKVIALSSASYQFEFLYKMYKEWIKKIVDDNQNRTATYFVSQLSYQSLPVGLIDEAVIKEARTNEMSEAIFKREYEAQFVDDSDSYFSAKKMKDCTVREHEEPTVEIIGEKDSKYIMAIDPSYSGALTSDHFACNIIKINETLKRGILVHNYAKAGGNLIDHIKYIYYLMTNFNIIAIIGDNTGHGVNSFIQACNESALFKDKKMLLNTWEADFDDEDFVEAIKLAKRKYNRSNNTMVYFQLFNTETIRKMNEALQISIDHKRIWFASKVCAHEQKLEKYMTAHITLFEGLDESARGAALLTLMQEQDDLIDLTKKECSLIEIKITPLGQQTFDLPRHLARSTAIDKARRDSYTALLMANWMMKCWFEMQDLKEEESVSITPFMA